MSGQERCYFATAEDGQPSRLQRKPFSECFYTVAMAELSRATAEQKYQVWNLFCAYNFYYVVNVCISVGSSREHAKQADLLDKS